MRIIGCLGSLGTLDRRNVDCVAIQIAQVLAQECNVASVRAEPDIRKVTDAWNGAEQEVEEHVGQHFRNDVAWNAVLETPGNQRDRDNGGNRVAGDRKQSEKRVETDRADHRQIHRRVHDAGEPLNRSRKFAPGLVLRKTFRSGVGPEMSEAPRRGSRRLLGTLSDACRGSTARDLCQDAANVVSHASRRAIEKPPQNEVTDRPRRREHEEGYRERKENVAERHGQGQYASADDLCRRMSGSLFPSRGGAMNHINTGGVIKGGLVAGLIINISQTILNVPVLGTRMEAELAARNLADVEGATVAIFVAMCFVLGLLMVWLYAAVRPRLGPGPKTAVCVGLVVWTLIYLWGGVGNAAMGFFSWNLAIIGMVWGLGESILAAVAGAYFYKE